MTEIYCLPTNTAETNDDLIIDELLKSLVKSKITFIAIKKEINAMKELEYVNKKNKTIIIGLLDKDDETTSELNKNKADLENAKAELENIKNTRIYTVLCRITSLLRSR